MLGSLFEEKPPLRRLKIETRGWGCVWDGAKSAQIRHLVLTIQDLKFKPGRAEFRTLLSCAHLVASWNQGFEQYLKDLDCPYINGSRPEVLDWLLGLAVQLEFNEKPESYTASPNVTEEITVKLNPIDNLDFGSEDFIAGVNQLADILQVTRHADHLVTLQGVCALIQEKFNQEAIKDATREKKTGNPVQFDSVSFGLDIKAPNVSQAANVLRYLFIHNLRDLQTKINECIVSVQALTANPKTDTKLGKVGY
uniref:EOG090X0ARU n=1 Tax=Simocephalus serrulatus TaxID=117539 RepID=A0A4Y7NQN9_9CRUS|nr:EOG090X0ARU [Simocephalus serrulatus]SVE94415.1 EOG090X0ARU [Simocephalus serrulatus]